MAEHDLEPLDPELRALIAADEHGQAMPHAVRARLGRRLNLSISLAAPFAGPDTSATEPAAQVAKQVTSAALAKKAWLLAAGAFVLGAGAGASVTATLYTPSPAPVATPMTTPMKEDAPHLPLPVQPEPSLPPPEHLEPVHSPVETRPVAPAHAAKREATESSVAPRDELLSEERSLVEMVRSALVRGDADGALRAVQLHARRFPQGRLKEERDSLWIQALVRAGKLAEARERARLFRAHYPQSLLLPLVENALSSLPVTEPPSAPESEARNAAKGPAR
jgi:hypothetical protein